MVDHEAVGRVVEVLSHILPPLLALGVIQVVEALAVEDLSEAVHEEAHPKATQTPGSLAVVL